MRTLMMKYQTIAIATLIFCFTCAGLHAEPKPVNFKAPEGISFRTVDILSEGTRIQGEVFAPAQPKAAKLPTIVMSHGWGGTAQGLRPDAVMFARNGFLVVTRFAKNHPVQHCKLIRADDD